MRAVGVAAMVQTSPHFSDVTAVILQRCTSVLLTWSLVVHPSDALTVQDTPVRVGHSVTATDLNVTVHGGWYLCHDTSFCSKMTANSQVQSCSVPHNKHLHAEHAHHRLSASCGTQRGNSCRQSHR